VVHRSRRTRCSWQNERVTPVPGQTRRKRLHHSLTVMLWCTIVLTRGRYQRIIMMALVMFAGFLNQAGSGR
jgi:hypothetical protein